MTAKYKKGIITITSIAVSFASITFMSWMGWESVKTVDYGERLVKLEASVGDIPLIKAAADSAKLNAGIAAEIMKLAAPNLGVNPQRAIDNVTSRLASTSHE